MKAFHDIRTEMHDTCLALTRADAQGSAAIARVGRQANDDEADSAIEPWMEAAFEGLTHASETGAPFALVSCFMNGEPAAVIALARPVGRKIHMTPLFLACQPWMKFASEPGQGGEDEDGGPDRNAADPPAPHRLVLVAILRPSGAPTGRLFSANARRYLGFSRHARLRGSPACRPVRQPIIDPFRFYRIFASISSARHRTFARKENFLKRRASVACQGADLMCCREQQTGDEHGESNSHRQKTNTA